MTLRDFFLQEPEAAIGFSGGVDSAFLLWAGLQYGKRIHAYYVHTAFQPAFELEDARRLAGELGADLTVLEVDILSEERVAANPPDRCYFCKNAIFSTIREQATRDGFSVLLDGTNASDEEGDRPGMRALTELRVRSPLRECGLTKPEIRELSRQAGLFTWDKPAYACLATRIPAGTAITALQLEKVERAEDTLRAMGFSDFRVRVLQDMAKLQVPQSQFLKAAQKREEILASLSGEFSQVVLDLKTR